MNPTNTKRVADATDVAVLSHNLLNDVARVAGLVHLLDLEWTADADDRAHTLLHELVTRSEQLVTRVQLAVQGVLDLSSERA